MVIGVSARLGFQLIRAYILSRTSRCIGKTTATPCAYRSILQYNQFKSEIVRLSTTPLYNMSLLYIMGSSLDEDLEQSKAGSFHIELEEEGILREDPNSARCPSS